MHLTHLPVGTPQAPFQNPSRGPVRRFAVSKMEAVDPVVPGFATRPMPVDSPTGFDLARLAWHFERHHHDRIRRDFTRMLGPSERLPSTPATAQLRALRGALEHHFYRNERLLFPEMRKRERSKGNPEGTFHDPVGPIERSNRDLRRLLTQTVRTLEVERPRVGGFGSEAGATDLLESIGAFLVLERELLLPRCREAFRQREPLAM